MKLLPGEWFNSWLESNVPFIKKQSQKSFRHCSTSKLRGGLSINSMEKGCRTEWWVSACVFVPLCLCSRNGHGSISLICHSRSTPKISYQHNVPLEWRVCRSSPPPLQCPLQLWPSLCSFLGRTAEEGKKKFRFFFFFFWNRGRQKKNQRVTSKVPRALFLIWLPLLQICRFPFTNENLFDWILVGKS